MPGSFGTDLAKERFYEQMERYRNLNDGLDLPAAVIPLYIGGLLFYADQLRTDWIWPWAWSWPIVAYLLFLSCEMATGFTVIAATWVYCRTIWYYQDIVDLPSPEDLETWVVQMEAVATRRGVDAETLCDPPLRQSYVKVGELVFQRNEARDRMLFQCRRRLVVALVLTAATTASYYVTDTLHPKERQKNVLLQQKTESGAGRDRPADYAGSAVRGSMQTPDPAKPEDKPDEIPQMPLRAIYRGKEYKAYAKED